MITVRITKGLGNQMFQYAIARMLAIKNDLPLLLDLTYLLKSFDRRQHPFPGLELSVFNIRAEYSILSQQSLKHPRLAYPIYRHQKLATKLNGLLGRQNNITETPWMEGSFCPDVMASQGKIYLTGYWQNELYFKPIEDQIREDFSFREYPDPANQAMIDEIRSKNSVSLHIRRGDYLNSPVNLAKHGVLNISYYNKAIDIIKTRVNCPELFVFSDDIGWAKENLISCIPVSFVNLKNAGYKDMRLMSHCKHHIIANSSFSWWGAWLAENKAKTIIAPAQWFTEAGYMARKNFSIVPERWIKV